MPDLTGVPALDVLIGLSFLYFLLAVVCSAINEAIAATLAWRSKNLEEAIRHLLGGKPPRELRKDDGGGRAPGADEASPEAGRDLTKEFFEHWRIRSLARRPDAPFATRMPFVGWRGPSYIPPRTFALTVFDTLFPGLAATGEEPDDDAIEKAKQLIAKIQNDRVRTQLQAIVDAAGRDRDRLRAALETWFDDTMERASGWYKRKTQIALFVIATVVAVGANASSIHVAHRLWTDDAVRAAVVAKAQQATTSGAQPGAANAPAKRAGNPYEQVADSVDAVEQLKLPLGWGVENRPPRSFGGVGGEIGGLIATIFAVMLGAPFWFDLLGRAAALRGAGKPQALGAEDEKAKNAQPGVGA
jgi:hypothetical protein